MRLSGGRNSNEQRGAAALLTIEDGTAVVATVRRRAAALMAALILIATVGFVVSRSARPAGADTVFASGQIFASVGGSQVYTYDPNSGLYLNSLTDSSNDVANGTLTTTPTDSSRSAARSTNTNGDPGGLLRDRR